MGVVVVVVWWMPWEVKEESEYCLIVLSFDDTHRLSPYN
jgi:hypothetical protein